MKKHIFLFALLLAPVLIFCQTYEISDEYWNQAEILKEEGKYLEAAQMYEKSAEAEKACKDPRLNELCVRLGWAGYYYEWMGQFWKALPLHLEAVEITEKNLGKDHPAYGSRLNNLAELYCVMGQFDTALPLFLEALENAEKAFGKYHPAYGSRLNNLALLYMEMDKPEEALPLYLEALENTEKALGKDHPEYGIRLNNIALLYEATGQYKKALPLFRESLENAEKFLGKDHSSYGKRLNNLAGVFVSMGQYEKALPLYLDAKQNLYGQLNKVFAFSNDDEKEKFFENEIVYNFEIYKFVYCNYLI